MILGVVVGTVVATRKEAELTSLKFLLVKPCDAAQWMPSVLAWARW
jgi:microcompartment protein CcmK/EutM